MFLQELRDRTTADIIDRELIDVDPVSPGSLVYRDLDVRGQNSIERIPPRDPGLRPRSLDLRDRDRDVLLWRLLLGHRRYGYWRCRRQW